MRIRIKTKWSKQEREVSVEDSVGVLAFNAWKIGMQTLLEIENENFQVDTQMQRIRIIEEIMAFLVHAIDRMVYDVIDEADRGALITLYAKKLADHVHENARDFEPNVDHRAPFIEKLNERMADYADTMWDDQRDVPGFNMGRVFANHVTEALGPRDQQWALDFVQQVLLPDVMQTYKRAVKQTGLIEENPDAE